MRKSVGRDSRCAEVRANNAETSHRVPCCQSSFDRGTDFRPAIGIYKVTKHRVVSLSETLASELI
jgi:hypothetical protein